MTARQGGASVVTYRLGGRNYPMRTAPNCRVCQSPYRLRVEQELAAGRVYARIASSLPEDADLSARNVSEHYKNGHMPLEVEASRRILERRAEDRGRDIERGVDALVDGMALAESVVQKTYEALQRGDIRPELIDGLRAAKLLEDYAGDDGIDQAAYVEAFMVYHEVAARIMSPEQFSEFGRALQQDPVLRGLTARHAQRDQEGEAEARA